MRVQIICFLVSVSLEAQSNCLDDVADFAERICGEIHNSGAQTLLTADGNLKAEVSGIVRRVLGGTGAGVDGSVLRDTYENVLREDLADELFNVRDCRIRMVDVGVRQICQSTGDGQITTTPLSEAASTKEISPTWAQGGFYGINSPRDEERILRNAEIINEQCSKCLRITDKTADERTQVPTDDGYFAFDARRCSEGVRLLLRSNPYLPPPRTSAPGTIGRIRPVPQYSSLDIYPGQVTKVSTRGVVNFKAAAQACLTPLD